MIISNIVENVRFNEHACYVKDFIIWSYKIVLETSN